MSVEAMEIDYEFGFRFIPTTQMCGLGVYAILGKQWKISIMLSFFHLDFGHNMVTKAVLMEGTIHGDENSVDDHFADTLCNSVGDPTAPVEEGDEEA